MPFLAALAMNREIPTEQQPTQMISVEKEIPLSMKIESISIRAWRRLLRNHMEL